MPTFTTSPATFIKATAVGAVGVGPISIPGLEVGDLVLSSVPVGFTGSMEPVITVADQLQQMAPYDWSVVTITFYLLRGEF